MAVFEPWPRGDLDPARHGEPHWSYLDRSAREEFEAARERINLWFDRLCADLQPSVLQRLRSRDDQDFASAYWELVLHEVFTRLGYDVACEPILPNGRRIDFRVARGGSSMFVEATIARSSETERAADTRRNRIYRELDLLHSDAFMVGIEIEHAGPGDLPNVGALRSRLETWLAGLDPDAVADEWEASESVPELSWEKAGWTLRFEAFPLKPGAPRHGGRQAAGDVHGRDRRCHR